MLDLQNPILNNVQTIQKIRRIAYQIYENNFDEPSLVFAGIESKGSYLAELLVAEFRQISKIDVILTHIKKTVPENTPKNSEANETYEVACDKEILANKAIIVIDDVLHTGRTLIYSLKPLLDIPVKKIQTVVLVKREHHQFPVHADYIGYALSTTIKQHIHVELIDKGKIGVYLF
jgi:pyrimidine operon attenuation protein/uracil phosphoribosyltransferase